MNSNADRNIAPITPDAHIPCAPGGHECGYAWAHARHESIGAARYHLAQARRYSDHSHTATLCLIEAARWRRNAAWNGRLGQPQ